MNDVKAGPEEEWVKSGEVRISDLAAELGVTKGTVSRPLNG